MEALAGELVAGRRALEQAQWAEARGCFEAVLAAGESGSVLEEHAFEGQAREGLGQALWFLADIAGGIASKAAAFELYVRAGRCNDAARCAVWVSHQHLLGGRASAARGWLARAERVLEGVAECEGHGWAAVERARHVVDPDDRAAHALRAVAIGRRVRASDLEIFALSVVGRTRVEAGHTEDGLLLLEEALAGAAGGQVRNVHTLAEAYCNLIIASTSTGDWVRATEWCEQVDAFARGHDTAPLFGTCRGVHADVLLATGHWLEAEQALETSLATHARYVPEMAQPSVASLAELRVRQGRLGDAEVLLAGREENPAALRVLAMLRAAQGREAAAVALLERALRHVTGGVVVRARLLADLVDARLAVADLEGAQEAAGDLDSLSRESGVRLVEARSQLAASRVARARGDVEEAVEQARLALTAFEALAMPLEAGEARVELARALALSTDAASGVALEEAQAALVVFRQLGAAPSVAVVDTLLRELAGTDAGASHRAGPLTRREQEVLELVAQGFSNARIASSLVITEKTAGHHVSHILAKLGVHNRTEAAAHVTDQR
ncbi:LuxR C-terminal-related transcriptional regulator [Nocardioides sp.]|uniref:LuxR C-terminal-related transcriptional regulator n=1 Tax=Nocardioides sp. TaxID=35761 RepID=UPI002C24DBF0|nr:LuxR C-terminal-related transcriptional regulator [Nocardioides sp.]HXH80531.1 LuxR C-terminal-related transcriptional regulator [Nocardioides sp.]